MTSLKFVATIISGCFALSQALPTHAQPVNTQPVNTQPAVVRTPQEEADLALRLADAGRADEALPLARSAYERSPRLAPALLAMGVALDASGRGYEAINYLTKYTQTAQGANDWRGHARLGSLRVRAKNYRLALRALKHAEPLVRDPVDKAYVLSDLAKAYAGLDETERFNETVDAIIALGATRASLPPEARAWRLMAEALFPLTGRQTEEGVAWYKVQQLDQALAWALHAAKLAEAAARAAAPDDRAAWDEARRCYEVAQRIAEADLVTLEQGGGPLADDQKKQRMSVLLTQVARLLPELGRAEQRIRLIDALQAARKAVELDENDIDALLLLAGVYDRLGDRAGCTATLKRVLSRDPDNATAREMLARHRAATPASAPEHP